MLFKTSPIICSRDQKSKTTGNGTSLTRGSLHFWLTSYVNIGWRKPRNSIKDTGITRTLILREFLIRKWPLPGRDSLEPEQGEISWSCLGMLRFHSEIMASLNFNKNKILSPGLENNHTLKHFFAIFQHNNLCQDCWKNTLSTFKCMVILKSRGTRSKKDGKLRDKFVHTFNKNLDLVHWIGE